jgi:AcrR family transcriptional regulator
MSTAGDVPLIIDGPAVAEAPPVEQRRRILDQALRLMAEGGAHATSMRTLAAACDLNVATIYHYFPSKDALLREVIADRNYAQLLVPLPPIDPTLPLQPRLTALLDWIWAEMGAHDDMWKLLLGESLRGEPHALTSAAELSATFEKALETWLEELFPDLWGDLHVTARVLRGLIYGFFIEMMPLPRASRAVFLAQRAEEVAAVVISR